LYAIIGIAVQVLVGELTGMGQGSFGILIFAFLVEIDPRFRFAYIVPNIKQKHEENQMNGENNE
jgi:hypothetical protein